MLKYLHNPFFRKSGILGVFALMILPVSATHAQMDDDECLPGSTEGQCLTDSGYDAFVCEAGMSWLECAQAAYEAGVGSGPPPPVDALGTMSGMETMSGTAPGTMPPSGLENAPSFSAAGGQVSSVTSAPSSGGGQVSTMSTQTSGGDGQVSSMSAQTSGGGGQVSSMSAQTSGGGGQVSSLTSAPSSGGGEVGDITSAPTGGGYDGQVSGTAR